MCRRCITRGTNSTTDDLIVFGFCVFAAAVVISVAYKCVKS